MLVSSRTTAHQAWEDDDMAQLTRKLAGDCAGNQCPAVYETDDPELVGVQGTLHLEPGTPAHEAVVLVPRRLLEGLGDDS